MQCASALSLLVNQIPVNLGALKRLAAADKPEENDKREQSYADNGDIVHRTGGNGQSGWKANNDTMYDNPQDRKQVAEMSKHTKIEIPVWKHLSAALEK